MSKAIEAAAKAMAHFNNDYEGPELQWQAYADDFRAGLPAYLAAMEAEGFVMVPVEPTEAMRRAGATADNDAQASPFWIPPEQSSLMVYAALIAAATPHDDGGE